MNDTPKEKRPEPIGGMLADRLETLKNYSKKIEVIDYTEWADDSQEGGVKLPPEVEALIQNPRYQRRVKYLVRNYGAKYIKLLAELAQKKGKPCCWFATCYSKARWEEQTLPFLKRLLARKDELAEKLAEIKINPKYICWYIKAEMRLGEEVLADIIRKATDSKVRNAEQYLRGSIKREYGRLATTSTR